MASLAGSQIQADDVHQLLGEMRIVGDLERLHAMRWRLVSFHTR